MKAPREGEQTGVVCIKAGANRSVVSDPVDIWRSHDFPAIAAKRLEMMLVGLDDEQVEGLVQGIIFARPKSWQRKIYENEKWQRE